MSFYLYLLLYLLMSYVILLVLAHDILVLGCTLLPLVALSILQLAIVDWFSNWYGMGLLVVLYDSVKMVEWRNLGLASTSNSRCMCL